MQQPRQICSGVGGGIVKRAKTILESFAYVTPCIIIGFVKIGEDIVFKWLLQRGPLFLPGL
ncbi:hypothetical protein WM30_24695 [Burkholderia ubonensis]|nr:hypothetical protein WM30_24695 [Burkholderia ubonensis]